MYIHKHALYITQTKPINIIVMSPSYQCVCMCCVCVHDVYEFEYT